MRLQCPQCGTELTIDEHLIDQVATCKGCRAKLRIPSVVADSAESEDEESAEAPLTKGVESEDKDLVDMTAMVDIVFFLLIFFMITTASGILSCIGMPPPKQDSASAAPRKTAADFDQDSECITVRIDEQNRIFIDDLEYPTEADLHNRLYGARAANVRKLLVKAHGNAHNGTYVMVQDLGYEIGFDEFMLSVAKEEEPQ